MFVPNLQARKQLSIKLKLEFNEFMQDWEWEISDYNRLGEFIYEYNKPETSDNEKISLMEIILDSLNNLILDGKIEMFEANIILVQNFLIENKNLHSPTLNYWTRNNFEISKVLKVILK